MAGSLWRICVHACVAGAGEDTREYQIPWSWRTGMCEPTDVGVGILTCVLCKSSTHWTTKPSLQLLILIFITFICLLCGFTRVLWCVCEGQRTIQGVSSVFLRYGTQRLNWVVHIGSRHLYLLHVLQTPHDLLNELLVYLQMSGEEDKDRIKETISHICNSLW